MNEKYSKEIHDQIVAVIKNGGTQRAAAQAFGVTPETVSHSKIQHPAFREDLKCAEAEAQSIAEITFYGLAKNSPKAMLAWLERRCQSDWSGKEQPAETVTWPDTFSGWTALHLECKAKFQEWLVKQGVKPGPQTPILGGASDGSESPSPAASSAT